MSIKFYTDDARALLAAIKGAIARREIETWTEDPDGDFTPTSDDWAGTAWLRPAVRERHLLLSIIAPVEQGVSSDVYAYFHGGFIESMLSSFDSLFFSAVASAMPDDEDSM